MRSLLTGYWWRAASQAIGILQGTAQQHPAHHLQLDVGWEDEGTHPEVACSCWLCHVARLTACVVFVLQGEGLQLLLNEGAEKNSWPKSFAATHKFKSDPVIPLPDVTMVDFNRELDEFLVVATDGLWDCMPPAEAIRFAR